MYLNAVDEMFDTFLRHEALPFKHSPGRFAGFDIYSRYPLVLGRYLQMLTNRPTDSPPCKIRMAIQMVKMSVTFQIAVADRSIAIIHRNQENPAIRCLFHISRSSGLFRTPNEQLRGTIIPLSQPVNRSME